MLQDLLNFSSKKDRNDFFIALFVIALFGGLFWYLSDVSSFTQKELHQSAIQSQKEGTNNSLITMDSINEEDTIGSEAVAVDLEFDTESRTEAKSKDIIDSINSHFTSIKETESTPSKAPISLNDAITTKDSDSDGVIDSEDDCPNQAGIRQNNGCPEEIIEQEIITESTETNGYEEDIALENEETETNLEPDSDNDGVSDKLDKCPDLFGIPANGGCPEKEVNENEREALENLQNIQFYHNSARIKGESKTIIDNLVSMLKKYPDYKLKIIGHTDSDGDETFNMNLSEKRARSCFRYIRSKGINGERISYEGRGESEPITENETVEGKNKNRRVQFILH